ncbi:TonB-dependent Receptor Plug Domain [Tenacibaculum sediminilitoris]|uniref:TonB-dependent receptor plug domain-containing protein n=1 Tax=Tenacibaculum sediminilitoris TaxID=1820334 RepID=UPI00389500B0
MKKIIFLFVALLAFNLSADSQTKKLTIQVTDENNTPVAGAIILLDNVRQKRWTNAKGEYKIKLEKKPKQVSAYSPKIGIIKVAYNGEKKLILKIKEGNDHYISGDTRSKNINPIQYRDIYDYLRGQVAGVNITGSNNINIRGYNSINGSTTPLFILNNTAVNKTIFSNIVPTTIKSIRVLKGPETATYGSRGANGVIIVQTR